MVKKTNAIGIFAKTGRYGGTYSHIDIALEFGMWISTEFKVYLIKEFRRLKEAETNHQNLEWSVQRMISKINYHIHTDAIKENLIPKTLTKEQAAMVTPNSSAMFCWLRFNRKRSMRIFSATLFFTGTNFTIKPSGNYSNEVVG